MLELRVNGMRYQVDVSPETSLLKVIRETLGLTKTRQGCGMAICGVCTIELDGQPVPACITPVSRAVGKHVVTVEGLQVQVQATEEAGWPHTEAIPLLELQS